LKSPATIAAIRRMIMKARPIRKLIQRGDNTHNQDQVITLVSLRPTNNTVNNPGKPIPEEEEDELDIVLELNCESVILLRRTIGMKGE